MTADSIESDFLKHEGLATSQREARAPPQLKITRGGGRMWWGSEPRKVFLVPTLELSILVRLDK
jgi:hypothetical protein